MFDVLDVLVVVVLSILIVSILIYCIPVIFLQRFHHRRYIFTINICISIFFCSIYWSVAFTMIKVDIRQFYNRTTCSLVFYVQLMCTLQVALALIVVSVHRLCCVIYSNSRFSDSKHWIWTCIGCQWLAGLILSFPAFIRDGPVNIFLKEYCQDYRTILNESVFKKLIIS